MALLMMAVMVVVLGGSHWYVWRRLVRDSTTAGSTGRRIGTGVMVLGGLFVVATLATRADVLPFEIVRMVSWIGYLWAVVLVYLLLGVLVGEIARPLLIRLPFLPAGRRAAVAAPAPDRATNGSAEGSAHATATIPPDTTGPGSGSTTQAGSTTPRQSADAALDTTALDTTATDPAISGTGTDTDSATAGTGAMTRRLFVNRALTGVTAVAAVATVGGGAYGVLNGPAVKHVSVPLRRLPAEAAGFRITLISDLHLGPVLGKSFARTVVDAVNGTQPDLIAIAGDLVDATVADLREDVAPLADLRAPRGVFFCMGNHEYYSGPDEWIEYLPSLGIRVLFNERVELPFFDLAGVDDLAAKAYDREPDFEAALGGRDTSRPVVLMAHQPSLIHDAVDYDVDLQLSGHTHGGQIFPGNLLAALANPTLAGLERYGDSQLYVTRGAGAWGPPVRVAAPSDITVLELVPADR